MPDLGGGKLRRLLLLTTVAAVGGFLFGFDTAVINGAVVALQGHFEIDAWTTGLTVSLALLGAAAGALVAGTIADRIGRPRTMQIAAALFLVSAIGSGFPLTVYDFTVWRVVGGVGVGVASVIAPAYIAEISPAHLRGRLGSLQQLAIVVGILVALLCNYTIARASDGAANLWLLDIHAWRWMFLVEAIPAVLYGVGAMLVPESPRYLVARGRIEEARSVLASVLGKDVQAKLDDIRSSLTGARPRARDVIGRLGLLPIVWVGVGLSALQQFVGINVIFYYSSMLWQSVGFDESEALWVTVITGVVNIATTLVAIAMVDRIGRKPLLLIGSVGMALSLGAVAYLFGTAPLDEAGQPALAGSAGIAALVAANLYVVFFGASWGPVVWVLLGEMFSNRIRATALSIAAGVQWIANFAVSTTFPPMAKTLGLGASYAMYATAAAVSIAFVWFFVRETKGRELESMQD
jgi:SP family sugar:H+ symporter-like MFS transporter